MSYRVAVSFNGVSKIELKKVSHLKQEDGIWWEYTSIWLYDSEGQVKDILSFSSDYHQPLLLVREQEEEVDAAA